MSLSSTGGVGLVRASSIRFLDETIVNQTRKWIVLAFPSLAKALRLERRDMVWEVAQRCFRGGNPSPEEKDMFELSIDYTRECLQVMEEFENAGFNWKNETTIMFPRVCMFEDMEMLREKARSLQLFRHVDVAHALLTTQEDCYEFPDLRELKELSMERERAQQSRQEKLTWCLQWGFWLVTVILLLAVLIMRYLSDSEMDTIDISGGDHGSFRHGGASVGYSDVSESDEPLIDITSL